MFPDVNSSVLGPASSAFKRCTECGEFKLGNEFHLHKTSRGGRQSYCKACHSEKARHYRSENAQRIREAERLWREKNADKVRETRRQYRKDNADRRREYNQRYYEEHLEATREYKRQYAAINCEAARERARLWKAANPDAVRVNHQRRRARKRAANGTHNAGDLLAVRAAQTDKRGRLICWYCGKPIKREYHIDHFVPLAKCGTNDAGNLRIACPKCNMSKGAKHPTEIGRLL